MKRTKFWLPALMSIVNVALLHGVAAALPKPISACGTTISVPGSYVVTANLSATSTSVPCISVTAPGVTLDLGGFVLTGKRGSGPGISATAGLLTITNGLITFFQPGISATAAGVKLRNVALIGNAGAGATLGDDAQVTDSKFLFNGGGLGVGKNALISHCTLARNLGDGLVARDIGAVATENVASNNGENGFATAGNATLTANAASGNRTNAFFDQVGASAFEANVGSSTTNGSGFAQVISGQNGNSVFIGNSAVSNSVEGFADTGGSTFEANTSDGNGGEGFESGAGANFTSNTANTNGSFGFFVINCPVNLIGNTAENNSSGGFTPSGTVGCNTGNNLGF